MAEKKINLRRHVPLCWMLVVLSAATDCIANDVGVQAPEGFTVSLYADDHLAHDIYSMTMDSKGRVVVSGAGYTRILVDEDGDGQADRSELFAAGPMTGAQGMYFDGNDLLCVGDAGLLRYRDRDGDDRADGPPEVLLEIRTGGEHHAHAIRRGPDGYWYLLVGNDSEVTEEYVTDPHSPIKQPRAGALLRLSPDFASCSVVMDGLRNAYDFDFHSSGAAFIYDSDDERDVTLPWYRPTRIFQVLAGAHAGWVSRSWKHPDYFLDMPPVTAQLGRGSPTGVVCYRHDAFPQTYRDALLVADWTFGRVYSVPLQQDAHTTAWSGQPQVFLKNVGQFGFAPTDLEVGPDGALYVSVGGRGTRGGVLRVTWDESGAAIASEKWLSAPQPLSSWSRAQWEPIAEQQTSAELMAAIADEQLSTAERLRAIEAFVALGPIAEIPDWTRELASWPPEVRTHVAWAMGRQAAWNPAAQATLNVLLTDDDPRVVAAALDSFLLLGGLAAHPELEAALLVSLDNDSPLVRRQAARVFGEWARSRREPWMNLLQHSSSRAHLALGFALVDRATAPEWAAFDAAHQVFLSQTDNALRLEALRVMQLALGDVGPHPDRDAVFDGYAPLHNLSAYQDQLVDRISMIATAYPTGHEHVDTELERWLAMVAAEVPELLPKVLSHITPDSTPTRDIHTLIVVARLRGSLGYAERDRIAAALAGLEYKVEKGSFHEDRNWAPRLRELFQALVTREPLVASALVDDPQFGHAGHAMFLDLMQADVRQRAVDRLLNKHGINATSAAPELLLALAQSPRNEHREVLRQFADIPAVAHLAYIALAGRPDPADRHYYYEGIRTNSFETVVSCLAALERMPPPNTGEQFAALIIALERLEGDTSSYQARERVARLLESAIPEAFGFVYGSSGHRPQPEVVHRWREWLRQRYPQAAKALPGRPTDLNWLDNQLASVDWSKGDAMRGGELFQNKGCHQCHGSRNALGPDLAGITTRFSVRDLFTAIAFPSLHVPSRYQTTVVETHDGKVYHGAIVYESVDGLTLISAANQTVRIDEADIAERITSPLSLMPSGLLEGCGPQDYADLLSYLKSLDGS